MDAVHRYEGTVNQVMGDGIMALFGAPVAHEDHAVRACYAALRMQEQVKQYAEDARRAHGVIVQIRVGLNSGEVVVHAIGSDLHMGYTAVGQTTHLAARMEQLASPGSVLLTPSTQELVDGAVEEFRARPNHYWPGLILLCAGMTYLSAGRIDEAASHAREALALTRRLGARGSEAHALCLAGDVALIGGAGDAEGYYHEALALAEPRAMRPLAAHCHLGLGKLSRRTGKREQAHEHLTTATTMYRDMDMRFWLEQAETDVAALD